MRRCSALSRWWLLAWVASTVLIAACSGSGPVRRVSDPAASIQQLTVDVDGHWSVDVRLQNFSSIPMRFSAILLAIYIGEQEVGVLRASPALTIGQESADIVTVTLQPTADARLMLADALATRRGISYRLDGSVEVSPHDRDKPRRYEIGHHSTLTPVPGLAGVLR